MSRLIIKITPMGKPRMTQRDRWKKRPRVLRYNAFKDTLRLSTIGKLPKDPSRLSWIAYLPIPASWPKKKKSEMAGKLHRQRPDRDNIDKAILDTLFKEDSGIASGMIEKRWDDGNGPRLEIWFPENIKTE